VPVLPSAVLKVSFPHPGNVHEPHAFAAWKGKGAVMLYERDDARYAMLLERARSETLGGVADADVAMAIAGRLARRLAVPAPASLPRLSDQAERWHRELLAATDVLSRGQVEAAIATFRDLGPDQPDTLVHGDLHGTNVLRSDRETWLAIDPKGQVGDLGHDAFVLLRTRFGDASLLRRLANFTEAAETDPERTRRWAHARAVLAAVRGQQHGDPAWLTQLTIRIAELLSFR
jgi:streptomycin 6-kinase